MGETCSRVEETSEKMAVLAILTWMESVREAWGGIT